MFFDKETYTSRRLELIKKVGNGIIILPGNIESARNFKANTYFFVQDSTFLYYTGIQKPDIILLLNCETGESILFGNDASLEHIVWMGPQESLFEMSLRSGINKVHELSKLHSYVKKNKRLINIHYLPPYKSSTKIVLSQLLKKTINEVISSVSLPLIKAVISQREIKTEIEIKEIEKAVNITREMHLNVINSIAPRKLEYNLVGVLESTAISCGSRTGYSPILSVQGQILHNFNYNNKLKKGQLILCDFGGVSHSGYAGDITRTLPVSGEFTSKQSEIYQIVLNAQKKAIEILKPDSKFKNIHLESCKVIVDGLKDLGLMKGNTEEAVAAGIHALFFPHGLGHMIGLDVHDMESLGEDYVGYNKEVTRSNQFGLKSLRLGKRLKQGNAITVEPGIYFIPKLFYDWKSNNKDCASFLNFPKIESYLNFGGIRIEDEYVITDTDSKLLGKHIPKEITEIEQLMKK